MYKWTVEEKLDIKVRRYIHISIELIKMMVYIKGNIVKSMINLSITKAPSVFLCTE